MDEQPVPVSVAIEPPRAPRSGRVIVLAAALAASLIANVVMIVIGRNREAAPTALPAEARDLDGRLIARWTYGPTGGFAVRAEAMNFSGAVDSIAYDADANGWYERHEVIGPGGLIATWDDRDGNGIPGDHAVMRRHGTLLAEHFDGDRDGWLDTIHVFDARGRTRLKMVDRDANGVAEQIQCIDEAGRERELPQIDCPL